MSNGKSLSAALSYFGITKTELATALEVSRSRVYYMLTRANGDDCKRIVDAAERVLMNRMIAGDNNYCGDFTAVYETFRSTTNENT